MITMIKDRIDEFHDDADKIFSIIRKYYVELIIKNKG